MTRVPLEIVCGESRLWAVPSIHYRLPFAEEVSRTAIRRRPDAVAVELGPDAAGALWGWLRDLGMDSNPDCRHKLPCMLGLVKPNRRIHPATKAAALRLQQVTGKELHQLPPELLKQFLGYSTLSVIYLSPTDSLVEAARCAVELGLPLYGVDLEECAEARRQELLIEDPSPIVDSSFEPYVCRNWAYAQQQRDEIVDSRRERAMAARLKTVLARHRRVLFACGLAHWGRLVELLADDGLRPAEAVEANQADVHTYQRVVVHPALALPHLDTLPLLAREYERHRLHAGVTSEPIRIDVAGLFRQTLKSVCEQHFPDEEPDLQAKQRKEEEPGGTKNRPPGQPNKEQLERTLDNETLGDFAQFLRNLCAVRQKTVPDIRTALQAAHGIMSEAFSRALADALMKYDWASPRRYPELPVLAPSPTPPGAPQRAELVDQEGNRSHWFYVHDLPDRSGIPVQVPIPWDWSGEKPPPPPSNRAGFEQAWLPTASLMSALMLWGVRVARDPATQSRSEVFEGSLLAGIDVKATLRAAARGDSRLYVKGDVRRVSNPRSKARTEELDGFPFVWIFRMARDEEIVWGESEWSVRGLLDYLPESDRAQWSKLASRRFVDAVIAGAPEVPVKELCLPGYRATKQQRYGQVCFCPMTGSRRTLSRWLNRSGGLRNPIAEYGEVKSLHSRYPGCSWHETLIRLAIPYANRAVTVAAPDGYRISPAVRSEAARENVEIRFVPLSYFPAKALREISVLHWLPVLRVVPGTVDLPEFPEHVMRFFGEPVDANFRLLPPEWR